MRANRAIKSSSTPAIKDSKLTVVMLLLLACSEVGFTQQSTARGFRSASEASQILYEAVKNNDARALRSILGCGPELLSSGEEAKDKAQREQFATKYREMHRLVHEPDGTTVLYIGAENWPFPIPLVSKHRKWYFDADAGTQEVLAREIGHNEVTAIEVCQTFKKLSGQDRERIPASDPIQEFAVGLEHENNSGDRGPFHGYYFRTLSGKGGNTVLVAFPAEYRSSGVMSFVITSGGAVYERDLGPDSSKLAQQVHGTEGEDWVAVQ